MENFIFCTVCTALCYFVFWKHHLLLACFVVSNYVLLVFIWILGFQKLCKFIDIHIHKTTEDHSVVVSQTNYGHTMKVKKNTLTGPANCKTTIRHYAHLSLCAKSRKTNDAKSRTWPKTSIWAIFWRIQSQISPNFKFFWKLALKTSFSLLEKLI